MRYPCIVAFSLGAFAAVSASAEPVRLFPGITRAPGSTAAPVLVLENPTPEPQPALLEMLPRGSAIASATRSVLLAPGDSQQIDLRAFLAATGEIGMLRVSGQVTAAVRLPDALDDSIMKEIPALDPERAFARGEQVDFPYAAAADAERADRSDLILVNLDSRDVTVTLSQGPATVRTTVPAGAFVQIDDLGRFLGAPSGIASARVVADGRWLGSMTTVRPLAAGQRRRMVGRLSVPPSAALIDKALAAGTIDAEQALTYKVFADFGDPRLPAAFRGDDSGVLGADSPGLAAARWASLSPATQDLIGPYLVPAFYEGSWWDARRTSASAVRPMACRPWATFETCNILTDWGYVAGNHVRVWYDKGRPEDNSFASDLAREADVKIWPELVRVMGREPILENEVAGSKLLDVVVVDNLGANKLATTFSLHLGSCKKDATFIVINRNIADIPVRRSAFAHELFHAVQHTYDTQGCIETDYKWLMESTATWFEDVVYPTVDREHQFAAAYLDETRLSIDATSGAKNIARRNYGAYTFFFYLTRFGGGNPNTVVRKVWEATVGADALHALKSGLAAAGVPLETSWPGFAVYSWNEAAPFDRYNEDKLTDKAQLEMAGSLRVPAGDQYVKLGDLQLELPHLSMRYFQFDFPDATASTVAFYNGIQRALSSVDVAWVDNFGKVLTAKAVGDPASIKGAHVEALLKIDGKWTREKWTDAPFKTYCRDLKAERIESLVIILSNSDIETTLKPQGDFPPIVQATNIGCYAWEGSVDLTFQEDGRVEKMAVRNLRLEALGDVPDAEETPLRRLFSVAGGTFHWSISGSTQGCTWSAPDVNESLGAGNFLYTFPYAMTPAAGARGILPILFQEWLQVRLMVKESGPTCSTALDNWKAAAFHLILEPDESYAQVSRDGKSYTLDASKNPLSLDFVTGTWTLTAKQQ